MEMNELEELRNFNELDLLYKIIDVAEDSKKRTEKVVKGNETAGVDVRHSMQDIRLLAEIIRESIQSKKGRKKPKTGEYKGREITLSKLEKAIVDKEDSEKKADVFANRAVNLRKKEKVK